MRLRRPIFVLSIALFACAAEAVTVDGQLTPPNSTRTDAGPDIGPPDAAPPAPTCADVKCPDYAFCHDGVCTCPNELATLCGGACVDLRSDPLHCGACGDACTTAAAADAGTTSACAASKCRLIEEFPLVHSEAPNLGRGEAITFDDDFVYILAAGAILRAPHATLSPFTRLANLQATPRPSFFERISIVVTDSDLYYNPGRYRRGVVKIPKTGTVDGGAPVTILANVAASALARSATHLYVGTWDAIYRMAFADGSTELFFPVGVSELLIDGDTMYFAEFGSYDLPHPIARVDITTKQRTEIAQASQVNGIVKMPDGIAWSAGLFFNGIVQYGDRGIFRWSAATLDVASLHAGAGLPTGIATDGAHLYWTNGQGFEVDDEAHALLMMNAKVDSSPSVSRLAASEVLSGAGVHSQFAPVVVHDSLLWLDYGGWVGRKPALLRMKPL